MVTLAEVIYQGEQVGAVAWDAERNFANFEYAAQWARKGVELAPIQMPLEEARRARRVFSFPDLPEKTFKGLPGVLADSLPDRFGNQLINAWLARQGRVAGSMNPVERLCYVGSRGMGALEFRPATSNLDQGGNASLEIDDLIHLATEALSEKTRLETNFQDDTQKGLLDILRVGTSAGGARAKAIVAINPLTKEVRSGHAQLSEGFEHWMIKFDGVENQTLEEPKGFGRIEYAYHLMATSCGITMSDCRLLEENGRAHFMTKRFDRAFGRKIHMQSLCAIAHFDYMAPGAYGYEQAFETMRQLKMPYPDAEQMYLRMLFNVIARNQDDHTKNIAFLMTKDNEWRLSPAFDMGYSYNPAGLWTSKHQMSIRGKRDHFSREDLMGIGQEMSIKKPRELIEKTIANVQEWPRHAKDAGVENAWIEEIRKNHRLSV